MQGQLNVTGALENEGFTITITDPMGQIHALEKDEDQNLNDPVLDHDHAIAKEDRIPNPLIGPGVPI